MEMKTVSEIYGHNMSIETAKLVLKAADSIIPILIDTRSDRVYKDLHGNKTTYTVDALEFWEEIHKQYSQWIKEYSKPKPSIYSLS